MSNIRKLKDIYYRIPESSEFSLDKTDFQDDNGNWDALEIQEFCINYTYNNFNKRGKEND